MTRAEIRALWTSRVATQQASGASAAAWCAQQDIPLQAFYTWRKKVAAPPPATPQWVALAPMSRPALTLRVGQVSIEVTADFAPRLLAEVLTVLEGR